MIAGRRHLKQIAPFFLQRPRAFPERADNDGGDIVRIKIYALKIKTWNITKVNFIDYWKTLTKI